MEPGLLTVTRLQAGVGRGDSPRPTRLLGPTAVAIAVGLVVGVLSRLGDELPGGSAWLVELAAPWLAVAFAVGATARRATYGGLVGSGALIAATLGYYGYMHFVEGEANDAYLMSIAVPWVAAAVVGGAVFGSAGAAWRVGTSATRRAAVGLLSAALLGEGAALLATATLDPAGAAVLVVEILAGVIVPFALLRSRRASLQALGVGIVLGVLVGAGCLGLPSVLRIMLPGA